MVRYRRNTVNSLLEDTASNSSSQKDSYDNHNEPPSDSTSAQHQIGMTSLRRFQNNKGLAAVLVFTALLSWLLAPVFRGPLTSVRTTSTARNPQFHLLLPASSSNRNFCRLLFSAIVLNYPIPVLINWDAKETDDPFDMHILKISKMLDYLEQFPPGKQDDLVLMVDAYDVWFQLPPETIIRRYHEQMKIDEAFLAKKYGKKVVRDNNIRHSVMFSNDKVCWPDGEGNRAACWIVPLSPISKYTYGPTEDITREKVKANWDPYHTRPRWLNSGSVMGPVKDMKKIFQAVADRLKSKAGLSSDQFYFAETWAAQEYGRHLVEPEATQLNISGIPVPKIKNDSQGHSEAELHMTIDYENALFQPIGYFDNTLSFLQYDGSLQRGRPKKAPIPYSDVHELEPDISDTMPPLHALTPPEQQAGQGKKRMRGWDELPLLTNLVTKHTTPIIHFMVEKDYRIKWWDRMWFAPFARDLFEASANALDQPILSKPVGGKHWTNALKPVVRANVDSAARRDGAWSDEGSWLSWNTLCINHEDYIFTADRSEAYRRPS